MTEAAAAAVWSGWVEHMRARGLAAGTIATRATTWRSWSAFVGTRLWVADHHDVEAWLVGRPIGAAAKQRAVSDLAQLYRWGRREGHTTAAPTDLVIAPRRSRGVPRPASWELVRAALGSEDPRLSVAVALMAFGGLRCVEVSRLVVGDLDLRAGVVYVTGKGGHRRWVPIVPPMRPYLYVLDGLELAAPVFGRRDGEPGPSTPARISQELGKWLRKCSRGAPATAHQLRHFYAAQVLERTGSLEVVQLALGHASISTTQIYAQLPAEAVRAISTGWGAVPPAEPPSDGQGVLPF